MMMSISLFKPINDGIASFLRFVSVGVTVALLVTTASPPAIAAEASVGKPVMRRLSPEQYMLTINGIFGRDIDLGGNFETEVREDGLLALGASRVSVSATGMERYDAMARAVAAQVVDPAHRDTLIPCKPASVSEPDNACARQFLAEAGRLLYRRPLTEQELQIQVDTAAAATVRLKKFYDGLGLSLAGMLGLPQFLFHMQTVEGDPANPGQYRLDAYSKASALSFLLWNSGPDGELLAAAESGALQTPEGLARQVDRLLASPRLEDGVRAFFTDMLQMHDFSALTKDAEIYPKFTTGVAQDAREQTMRVIVDHVVTRGADYRDLFTTRRTFLTPALGAIYQVPVRPYPEKDSPSRGWQPYEFPEGDHRAGLLTQLSFVAMHSHPGRSSPTLRGKAVREIFLCQKVPDPPGNVNFEVVQDTKNTIHRTARERLDAHAREPMCKGCHKLVDPIGLALENFDSAGGFRTSENGAAIDTKGEIDGVKYEDALGLAKAVHDSPAATACLLKRVHAYATGRKTTPADNDWIKRLQDGFIADGYKIPALLRRIATDEMLYRVARPQTEAANPATTLFAQTTAQ